MLQFITHPSDKMTILEEIENAVNGGCKWVQLRMKNAPREEIIEVATKAKDICKEHECILVIDDYVDIAKELALVKEIQYHAVTDNPIHADFQRVSMKDKMDVVVPLKLEGTPADVANYGAIIEHILREIEVRALVSAIPHEIVLDITPMTINKGLLAGDIKLPEGVELVTDPEAPVVHLAIPKEEAPAPAAADAAAQPESSSTKGKKDEEGNLTKDKEAPKK